MGQNCTVRFVMNSQLVTDGCPWVVIPVECQQEYMAALEKANEGGGREVCWEIDVRRGVFFCARSDEWEKICIFALLNVAL